jgi:tRNA A37 N6-isopentenylltransferase MiaA
MRAANSFVHATRRYAKRQLTWFRAKSTFRREPFDVIPSDLDRLALAVGAARIVTAPPPSANEKTVLVGSNTTA